MVVILTPFVLMVFGIPGVVNEVDNMVQIVNGY